MAQISDGSTSFCLKRSAFELLVASFIVLFLELALIRWLGTQIRALAYFPNLILISAFLGLGLGCLRANLKSLWFLWPVSLGLLGVSTFFMRDIVFTHESASEHLWLLYFDASEDSIVIDNIYLPIIFYFILSCTCFIGLGQFVGERIEEFRVHSSALAGYCWDILGSLLGAVSFTFVSYLGVFPIYWFASVALLGLLLLRQAKPVKTATYVTMSIVLLGFVQVSERGQIYSPYYSLRYESASPWNFRVLTNGSLHQRAIDVSLKDLDKRLAGNKLAVEGYNLPYQAYMKPVPKKILVLGGGTGNDVATAVLNGVEQVDVVEIDPEIINLGKLHHPNKPYSVPGVRVFNTDARSYLSTTKEKYDLVVFGTLDSMTSLSALSNVRLDNFVYTKEAIASARAILKPDGGIMLLFAVTQEYISSRLMRLLAQEFEQLPLMYIKHHSLFNLIYMSGPAFDHINGPARAAAFRKMVEEDSSKWAPASTDDWPYLYLRDRSISPFYLIIVFIIAALGAISVYSASPSKLKVNRTNIALFCFGLAFLLIETKSVTSMNLLWGATWFTSAIVFASILLMVLLATLLSQRVKLNFNKAILCLAATIVALYLTPVSTFIGLNLGMRLLASVFVVGLPIFFAAVCFALLFADTESANQAFGWNILGAVVGGLLEFFSMLLGLKALLLVALLSYLVAYLVVQKDLQVKA